MAATNEHNLNWCSVTLHTVMQQLAMVCTAPKNCNIYVKFCNECNPCCTKTIPLLFSTKVGDCVFPLVKITFARGKCNLSLLDASLEVGIACLCWDSAHRSLYVVHVTGLSCHFGKDCFFTPITVMEFLGANITLKN